MLLLGLVAFAGQQLGADSHLTGGSDPPGDGEAVVSGGGNQVNIEFDDCSTFVGYWDVGDGRYEDQSGDWIEFDYVTANAGRYSSNVKGNGTFLHN